MLAQTIEPIKIVERNVVLKDFLLAIQQPITTTEKYLNLLNWYFVAFVLSCSLTCLLPFRIPSWRKQQQIKVQKEKQLESEMEPNTKM